MTNRKIYIFFRLLVCCFCVFLISSLIASDGICDPSSCREYVRSCSRQIDSIRNTLGVIYQNESIIYSGADYIAKNSSDSSAVETAQLILQDSSYSQRTILDMDNRLFDLSNYITGIDCNSCTNGQCFAFDFDYSVFSNILQVVDVGFSQVADSMTNIVSFLDIDYDSDYGDSFSERLEFLIDVIDGIDTTLSQISTKIYTLSLVYNGRLMNFYRVYDPFAHETLSYLASNLSYSADFSFTNRLYSSSLLGWDRFQSYLQAQNANQTVSWYPVSPYNSQQNLRNATIYDALAAGFENTLISLGSLNNYFYWIKNHMPSNSYDDAKVLASLSILSNQLKRIDSYVVQDFSNEFYRLARYLTTNENYRFVSSVQSNYYHSVTSSLFSVVDLLDTNNMYLASIEQSVTNIDFSVGRFRDYLFGSENVVGEFDGGDQSYYDFLTNKYLSGGSDSSVSSNWFERIETLLAALVFSTDSKTNIVSSGSFDGISESDVRGTLEDVSFANEFNDMVASVGDVQRSFTQILNSLHSSVKHVVKPQSISIGFTDTGNSTTDFDALSGGEFEVSVSVGEFGSFTEVVRAVTTMIIVLITLIMIYKTCFFLIRNAYRLYSFGRTLVTSIFFR